MANEDTYENLSPDQKEKAIFNELKPFVLYAAFPIVLTIILAFVFGPSLLPSL